MPPDPILGGATVPLPRPYPLGTPALRIYRALLGAFGPSIIPANQKSWIHPWAHPPSENPGYNTHAYCMQITKDKFVEFYVNWSCYD